MAWYHLCQKLVGHDKLDLLAFGMELPVTHFIGSLCTKIDHAATIRS